MTDSDCSDRGSVQCGVAHLTICRASWRPFSDRACRAIAAVVALLLCSMGLGRLPATISRWLTCAPSQRKEGHNKTRV